MGRRAAGVGAFIPFVGKPAVLLDAIHRGVSTCRFTLVILTAANFRAVARYVPGIEFDLTDRTSRVATEPPKAHF
ncbi:conserved hypothetical protein [Ricinus communis]|nr:conserved hypothetical protein [Ricinus communis]